MILYHFSDLVILFDWIVCVIILLIEWPNSSNTARSVSISEPFEDFAATSRQFVAELITGGVILVCKIRLAPILSRFDFGSEEFGSNGL